jgi:xanthine dehydrogenase YagT iron-sulfur-binding subunit
MDRPSQQHEIDEPVAISRRQLLAGAAAAGAGIAAGSLLGCQSTQTAEPPVATPAPEAPPAGTTAVSLSINGGQYDLQIDPRVTLLDALREYIGLTGTKKGCDHGQCGACTVLIDGRRINSCLQLAIANQGRKIVTIEGLADDNDQLHPIQAAFIQHDAFQCGYCTPGQICSAVGLIAENHAHSEDEIREQMSGNICRCGAYVNIVAAVRQVIAQS